MSDLDREVAGIRCREVLTMLADFVEGDLRASDAARVSQHLRGCDQCEKFGGEYGALVGRLRRHLATVPDDEGVLDRLARRMGAAWTQDSR